MNDGSGYTNYHPRWYRPRISTYWWLKRWSHTRFIIRELSSVFVAWFVIYWLILVRAVSLGPAEYQWFLGWSHNPLVLLLNAVGLVFVLFHALTWFNLAPQAMPVRVGGRRVPDPLIAASNYAAWAVVSAAVAWLLIGG